MQRLTMLILFLTTVLVSALIGASIAQLVKKAVNERQPQTTRSSKTCCCNQDGCDCTFCDCCRGCDLSKGKGKHKEPQLP